MIIKFDVRAWLEKHEAYTIHRPVWKCFAPNTYTVNNVMDVWECGLLNVQSLANNDSYNYILSVIEFSRNFCICYT